MYAYAPPSSIPTPINGPFTTNDGTSYPANWIANSTVEELKGIHVYEVIESTIPEGKRIVSTELQRKTGPVRVERVATFEDIPLAELKATKKATADAMCEAKMSAGYDHDFGGAYGVKTLQTRESDQPYWLALATTAMLIPQEASAGAIRTEDNVNVPVTAAQALAAMMGMQAYLSEILGSLWTIKDAIAAATTEAELNAIDLSPLSL